VPVLQKEASKKAQTEVITKKFVHKYTLFYKNQRAVAEVAINFNKMLTNLGANCRNTNIKATDNQ